MMMLSRGSIEILVDLVENKMFDMAEIDDDPRAMVELKRCRSELIAIQIATTDTSNDNAPRPSARYSIISKTGLLS